MINGRSLVTFSSVPLEWVALERHCPALALQVPSALGSSLNLSRLWGKRWSSFPVYASRDADVHTSGGVKSQPSSCRSLGNLLFL